MSTLLAVDFDITPWSAWAGLAAAVVVIVSALCGAVWFIVDRVDRRFAAATEAVQKLDGRLDGQDTAIAVQTEAISAIKAEQAKQFGGNSGGIREAVNGVVATTARIETRLDAHLEFHSRGKDT